METNILLRAFCFSTVNPCARRRYVRLSPTNKRACMRAGFAPPSWGLRRPEGRGRGPVVRPSILVWASRALGALFSGRASRPLLSPGPHSIALLLEPGGPSRLPPPPLLRPPVPSDRDPPPRPHSRSSCHALAPIYRWTFCAGCRLARGARAVVSAQAYCSSDRAGGAKIIWNFLFASLATRRHLFFIYFFIITQVRCKTWVH